MSDISEMEDLQQRIANVELALRGDLSNPGLIHQFLHVMKDIYDQGRGLQPRLEKVEQWQIRKESFVSGAGWAGHLLASGAGGLLVWLLGKVVHF